MFGLRKTEHAKFKMGQRGISDKRLGATLKYGEILNKHGAYAYHYNRLTVLVRDNAIITAYNQRHRDFLKECRKSK